MRKRRRLVAAPRTTTGRVTPGTVSTRGFSGVYRRLGVGNNPELKSVEFDNVAMAVDTTGQVQHINGIASGTSLNQRVGRKVVVKSAHVRWTCGPGTIDALPNIIRVMLITDMQPNSPSTPPAVTDVLQTADVRSHLNLNNRDRFRVLYDKTMTFDPIDLTTAGNKYIGTNITRCGQVYKKMNFSVTFSGTDGTLSSIATGAIYVLTLGSEATADNNEFLFTSRVRYVDN